MADPFTLHAPYLLRGQTFTEGLKIFYVNFFSLLALPTTIFLILILILYREELCKISFIKKDNLRIIGSPFALFLWIVFLEIFFIISSYLGFIPWHINQRWSLGIQYASTISVIGLIGYMYIWLTTHIRKIVLSPYVILLLIFFYGIVLFTTCLKQGDSRDSLYSNLITRKEKIYTERYYINYRSLAMIRYLFEFGPFKSLPKEIYPNHFTFETKEEHDTSSAINLNKIDVVLISHDTPEDYISRFSSKLRDITIYKPSYMFEKLP